MSPSKFCFLEIASRMPTRATYVPNDAAVFIQVIRVFVFIDEVRM